MGYPMTYTRVVNRNRLFGDYDEGMIAGDLRRLEKDSRDEASLKMYAERAGITPEQAKRVLDDFFEGFGAA